MMLKTSARVGPAL